MSKKKDYQWPSGFILPENYYAASDENLRCRLINVIESFFKKKYEEHVALVPSGRSAIALLLKYKMLNRAHTVFIPKWSSFCMYGAIGNICNISTDYVKPDFVLINHKWGNTIKHRSSHDNGMTMEDSVDTIHYSKDALFPNDSDYEIISLPKVIGSFSGGVIITKDTGFYDFVKCQQGSNKELGELQSSRKNRFFSCNLNPYESWYYDEMDNTYIDVCGLEDIKKNLLNFDVNAKIIAYRRDIITSRFPGFTFDEQRLGPVALFPASKYLINNNEYEFMKMNFNFSGYVESECFDETYLLPLHYKITGIVFDKMLSSITKKNL